MKPKQPTNMNTINFQKDLFDFCNGTLTGTTTLGHSGYGSNENEGMTPCSPVVQNWSFTTRCSLVSYPGQGNFEHDKNLMKGYCSCCYLFEWPSLVETWSLIALLDNS